MNFNSRKFKKIILVKVWNSTTENNTIIGKK